jgi:hypothetical protein
MARINKKGTSFSSLGLELGEERELKKYLASKQWSAKRYLRYLVRSDLRLITKLNIHTNGKTS